MNPQLPNPKPDADSAWTPIIVESREPSDDDYRSHIWRLMELLEFERAENYRISNELASTTEAFEILKAMNGFRPRAVRSDYARER